MYNYIYIIRKNFGIHLKVGNIKLFTDTRILTGIIMTTGVEGEGNYLESVKYLLYVSLKTAGIKFNIRMFFLSIN